jgi:predicted helicase
LVKNPNKNCGGAQIFYKDIGDYLSREEKLAIVREGRSILNSELKMIRLQPDKHGDWITKRDDLFGSFVSIEPVKKFDITTQSFFSTYAIGIATNRDAWVYGYSCVQIEKNMRKMIDFYNKQIDVLHNNKKDLDSNPSKISWTVNLKNAALKKMKQKFNNHCLVKSIYRPYCQQNLYFDENFVERPGIHAKLFPTTDIYNLLICISGIGSTKNFSSLIADKIPCLDLVDKSQCFPLYWYEKKEKVQGGLFEKVEDDYVRHDAISDFILDQAHTRYGLKVTKEDIFYYVYGLLHSPGYRKTFANDLKKMLPRLPLVEKPSDFWAFSQAGRQLADLHLNYEDQKKPPEVTVTGLEHKNFTVTKMSFPAKGKTDTINYNAYITIFNIPEKAYQYIVNGKSAIEWIMERYAVTTHKESGIRNDPNDWAIEHNNPRYILDLLLSVIKLSIETVDIIKNLPKLEWK